MKKIASIFAMLLMVVTISFSLNSCGSLTIGAAISQLNSECPQDMGNGLTMTKSELVDGNWVITISAPQASVETFNSEAAKPALVQFIKGNEEYAKLLKETNTALIYKFVFADGEDQVSVSPSEM